jgi:hypothetical protein
MSGLDSVIVNDDFLTSEEIKYYYDLVTDNSFPWFYNEGTGIGYDNSFNEIRDDVVMTHMAMLEGQPNSGAFPHMLEIFKKFCEAQSITYSFMHRARINLFLSGPESYRPTGAHIDMLEDHLVFLYYFNDSDGDTVFYKEVNEGSVMPESLTEVARITPRAGRGVVFDGRRFHSPSPPYTHRTRITLNIDFR